MSNLDLSLLARQYVSNNWALVPLPGSSKRPHGTDWNLLENCVTNVEQCSRVKANVGLALLYSRVCVLDLDDMVKATSWLSARGIDVQELWNAPDAVRISSGKPNRGKLVFTMPENVVLLQTHNMQAEGLELRCGTAGGKTVQDVLPPSIHPDTGRPYVWEYAEPMIGDWHFPPPLPAAVLKAWLALDRPAAPETSAVKESMGLSRAELRKLIYQEDPSSDYNNWLAIGFALHHELRGAQLGLDLWDEWSIDGDTYPGREHVEYKWSTFGRDYAGPERTIRFLMSAHGVATADDFDTLEDADTQVAARAEKFAVRSAGEFTSGPPQEWIIKGVLPKAQLGMIYGESTAGKSFVAMDMLAAIARGENWRGMRTKALRTVMVIAEGAGGAKGRVKAYEQHFGVSLTGFPFGIIQDRPDLYGKSDHRRLAAQITAWGGADIIVVDTLAQSSAGANENSGEDMGTVLAHCQALSAATAGAMVLLVHHAGKDASRGARGWSGLKAAMDVEIEVTRHPQTGRAIRLSKSKDGDEGQAMGFKLGIVTIGMDEDGDDITSCIVEHVSGPVPSSDTKDGLKNDHKAVLQVVTEATASGHRMHYEAIRKAAVPFMEQRGKTDNRMRDAGKAIEKLESLGMLERDDRDCFWVPEA